MYHGGKDNAMSKPMKKYGTDNVWYTIVHRKKGERRAYRIGYRSEDLNLLRTLANKEVETGDFSMVKIVNADTNEDKEYFTKAHR